MKQLRIEDRTRRSVVATRVGLANGWWQRARGYLGRPEPGAGEGLLLEPCRAVHMLGLRYALDVVMIDRERRVIALYPALAPGGRTAWHRAARFTLELRAGSIEAAGIEAGDELAWSEVRAGTGETAPPPDSESRISAQATPTVSAGP
jgi:uncharacterized membrane protein (UPF0127 family)